MVRDLNMDQENQEVGLVNYWQWNDKTVRNGMKDI